MGTDRRGCPTLPASRAALLAILLLGSPTLGGDTLRIRIGRETRTAPADVRTVREALAAAGVMLGPEDEVRPPLNAPPPADGAIRVVRVTWAEETREEPIPYRTVVRPAGPGRRPRHPTVVREGRPGVRRVTFRVRSEDGVPVARMPVSEEVVREPTPQIVVSRNPLTLGSRGAYAGLRTLTVVATAYDPGPGSCGRSADLLTCNGKRAGYGVIAVDPRIIPLGTKLFVPGYGYGIAADVGGAIKGYRIDLGFNSRAGARRWGRRRVTIRIVD